MKIAWKKRKLLKKGSGEAVGFVVLMPVLILILYSVIEIMQLSAVRQKMEYAAYAACRAAVVSDSESEAKVNANKVAQLELGGYSRVLDPADVKARLTIKKNAVKPATPAGVDSRDPSGTMKTKSSSWIKGSFVECELTATLKKKGAVIHGQKKKCKVTMALEKEDY